MQIVQNLRRLEKLLSSRNMYPAISLIFTIMRLCAHIHSQSEHLFVKINKRDGACVSSIQSACLREISFILQGYRYHKLRKTFSNFYRRHYKLVSKFNVWLNPLLHQGLSESEFYGDLVYKFKKIEGRADFSDQFRKIIQRYKRIGYNINIMRQSACLVMNPITVNNFASLFNCTPVGRASDSMMAST